MNRLKGILFLGLTVHFFGGVRVFALPVNQAEERAEKEDRALALLMRQVVQLSMGDLGEPGPFGEKSTSSPLQIKPRSATEQALFESGTWSVMKAWMRLYYRELHRGHRHSDASGSAQSGDWRQFLQSEAALLESLEVEAAKGGVIGSLRERTARTVAQVASESADLGARHGKAVLVAKITAEAAEEALTLMAFNVGVHVLCQAIDVVLVFLVRRVQSWFRAMSYQHVFSESVSIQLVRRYWVARAAKNVFKKVDWTVEPFEMNANDVASIDQFGPNRYWGLVSEGKRAAFLKWVEEKARRKGSTGKGRNSFQFRISRDQFFGKRYARFGYLLSRKNSFHYMRGTDSISKRSDSFLLWPLVFEESVVEPALFEPGLTADLRHFQSGSSEARVHSVGLSRYAEWELKRVEQVLNRAGRIRNREVWSKLLGDVAVIFDASRPRRERYALALLFEEVMGVWVYQQYQALVREQLEKTRLTGWQKARIRYRLAEPQKSVYELSDFLRVAALSQDSASLKSAQGMSERFLIALLQTLESIPSELEVIVKSGLPSDESDLRERIDRLEAIRPWGRRRHLHIMGALKCEAI